MLAEKNICMRVIILNLFLLAALSIMFSACGGSEVVNNNAVTPPSSSTPDVAKEKEPSEYPPLVSAVSQSDFKNMDGSTFKITDKKGKVVIINMHGKSINPREISFN